MKKTNNTIAVLGLWHLGIITAVSLSELGFQVIGFDPDKKKIINLKKGIPHIFEPQLEELLEKNLKKKRITFTNDLKSVKKANIIYLAFDTPLNERDEVDTSVLLKTCRQIAPFMENDSILIVISQVPMGTTQQMEEIIKKTNKKLNFQIVYIPENLRLGKAFERFFKPAMIVIGTEQEKTFRAIEEIYEKVNSQKIWVSVKTAELVKHAINTYLATSISFANEVGNIADLVGADFFSVAKILRLDERIGQYARIDPGLGFAGGTLARDLKILQKIGDDKGHETIFIDAVLSMNDWQKKWVVRKLKKIFKNDLKNKKIGILGLTYTPGTSTLRRSLAVESIYDLLKEKAKVLAFDPKADKKEIKTFKGLRTTSSLDSLAKNCDAIVLMTEWPEFLKLDFKKIKSLMKTPIFVDPKNALSELNLSLLGFSYFGIGRGERYENL